MSQAQLIQQLRCELKKIHSLLDKLDETITPQQKQPVKKPLTINLQGIYNEHAEKHGWPKVKLLNQTRKKGAAKAMKAIPKEEDWHRIFDWISKDQFWGNKMDFDKIYRNERYVEFYEKSSEHSLLTKDPLDDLFL